MIDREPTVRGEMYWKRIHMKVLADNKLKKVKKEANKEFEAVKQKAVEQFNKGDITTEEYREIENKAIRNLDLLVSSAETIHKKELKEVEKLKAKERQGK